MVKLTTVVNLAAAAVSRGDDGAALSGSLGSRGCRDDGTLGPSLLRQCARSDQRRTISSAGRTDLHLRSLTTTTGTTPTD